MPGNNALDDLWSCNTWAAEPGEQAAVDQAAYGSSWTDDAWAAGDDETPQEQHAPSDKELFDALTADWPDVPTIISRDRHIHKGDSAATSYWQAHWKPPQKEGKPPPEIQCGDFARYQMRVADEHGYDARGSSSAYQLYRRQGGVDRNGTVNGLNYVKETLKQRMPVYVGVWLIEWEPNTIFNKDLTTNHFVVLVGMGKDDSGPFLLYYDSLDASAAENRFCLKPNIEVRFCNDEGYSIIAQVRQTVRL